MPTDTAGLQDTSEAVDARRVRETTTHQRQRGRARARLPVRYHLLDEPLVLGRLAVVERRALDDLPRGEPHEGLWREEAAGEVEEDLWEGRG